MLGAIVATVTLMGAAKVQAGAPPVPSSDTPNLATVSPATRKPVRTADANRPAPRHPDTMRVTVAADRAPGDRAPGDLPAHARLERWRAMIGEASQRFAVPPQWITRVMIAESAGLTHRGGAPIRSRKGAIGLMQLMPGTWREIRAKLDLGDDPDQPRDNILAGTYYLRTLYDRFGYPGLFAAYNAGPARYERYLAGTPLPAETRAYLARTTSPDRSGIGRVRGVAASISGRAAPVTGGSLFALTQGLATGADDVPVRDGPRAGAERFDDLAGAGRVVSADDEAVDAGVEAGAEAGAGAARSLLRHASSAVFGAGMPVARPMVSPRQSGGPHDKGGVPGRGPQSEVDRAALPATGHTDAAIFAVRKVAR